MLWLVAMAAWGSLTAGIYGIIHDQITFTLSPEYLTRMKFQQSGGGQWLDTVCGQMRARPQGTPVERPVAKPTVAAPDPAPADDTGGGLGGFSAFGGGGFNFSSMLDDLPGDDKPAEGDPPAG